MAQRYTKCYACGSYTFPIQRPDTGSIIPADLPNATCVRCMLDVMQERGLLKQDSQAPPPPPPLPKPD